MLALLHMEPIPGENDACGQSPRSNSTWLTYDISPGVIRLSIP